MKVATYVRSDGNGDWQVLCTKSETSLVNKNSY
jgi:hypothetical protein